MAKTATMEATIDDITQAIFGRSRSECLASQTCVSCGGEAMTFHSVKAQAEYNISALCDVCQDRVFGNLGDSD